MLYLQFQIGPDRYALDIGVVAEVLPLLHIRALPQSGPGVAGVVNYRGTPVPAIDLCQITHGTPALRRLNTRIVMVRRPGSATGSRLVGLIAEKVSAATSSGESSGGHAGAPAAGSITTDADGLLHWLDISRLPNTADIAFHVPAGG